MPSTGSHRRGQYVRDAVLDAAFDELTDHGVAGATVSGVARRSGVHETTIYRRWTTRENLLVDAMLRRGAEAIPDPDTGSTRGDLLAVARALVAYLNSPGGRAVLHAAMLSADDDYNEARQAFWSARYEALAPVAERAIARGDLRPGIDVRLLEEMLAAPLYTRILLTGEPIDDDIAEHLVDLVIDGAARRD
jgi:AcrR family transcriptional regulator